jgi:formate hydrogenlyase subunit 3/multisubunit Na+/H+ antiporter MnhD subunit
LNIGIRNVMRYIFIAVFVALLAFLALPLIAGMVDAFFGEQGFVETGESDIDASGVLILTLISVFLGALTFWFADQQVLEATAEKMIKLAGKLFLFSALCFAAMALILPLMPELRDSIAWWETGIRYSTGILFIAGIISFAISLCAGIAFIWEIE